ncbi:MAG: HD-GYP domain-containing protein (c-di-GMP phosphodiesterase class II) [Bermanella sp.]|jgi:HD-GYP domain-containing protein (c-di-GMP phosphodiesterase class II)
MNPMQEFNYQSLVKIGRSLISERNITKLCELILEEAQALTGADGGTLYLVDSTPATCLNFSIVHNISLNTRLIANPGESIFEPIPLFKDNTDTNQNHVAAFTAHAKTVINIDNAYDNTQFDFSGAKKFDLAQNYKTQSVLAVPLLNEMNQIIGMIQLINATDPVTKQVIAFPETVEPIVTSLAMFAATALENRTVSDNQRELLIELAATTDTEQIIERILDESISITHSEGGTLYLIEKGDNAALTFEIIKNDTLDIYMGGKNGPIIPFPSIPLFHDDGTSNEHNVAAFSANSVEVVNIPDVYQSKEFDFSGAREFDIQANYKTKSVLTLPLLNHQNEVIGVLQLINARHPDTGHVIPYSERFIPLLKGLALYAAIALNNQILVQDLKNLLDAFVRTIAKAIDAKSPHTSGHCQRVPLLMELMAEAACRDSGKYKDFQLNEEEWYELRVSAWMHDCGKLATPDSVLDKSTKLDKMRDGIELIATRFSVLKHHKKIQYLESCIDNPSNQETQKIHYLATISKLDDQFEFVKVSNKGGEFMSEESKARIVEIAEIEYPDIDGKMQNILDKDEVYNLCIERGTLTTEERQIINNHMIVTIDMLEELPFPKQLQRVPEYAGGHHEKMNGTGFPKGLTKDQMSIPARMMAIADIFEALTARDRPYKDPMKISLSLNIMGRMVKDEHIDPDLFELFVTSRVWEKYAKSVLSPEQIDVKDIEPYLISV